MDSFVHLIKSGSDPASLLRLRRQRRHWVLCGGDDEFQLGLYDDSPHTREIVCNQMRLRAVRVIVDAKVALGIFTPDQGVDFLEANVPIGAPEAREEVTEMGELPGQKIPCELGKLQIIQMLHDAQFKQGDRFSLESFHDYLWLNGNVQIALLRWEYLGQDDNANKSSGLK